VLFVEGSLITNVVMMNPINSIALFIGDNNVTLDNVRMETDLVIQGQDARLNNITAPQVEWWDAENVGPSSGVMLSPLLPDADKVYDLTEEAAWKRALLVDRDGNVTIPGYQSKSPLDPPPEFVKPGMTISDADADKVPLTLRAAEEQETDIQRWEDSAEAAQMRVNKSGHLIIRKAAPPADNDLVDSEFALWLDATPSSTLLMIMAKDSNGDVVEGSVRLE
jgi:hypothetical protein